MPTTRQNTNDTYGPDGALISSVVVTVDVTEQTVRANVHNAVRAAIAGNRAFLTRGAANTNVQVRDQALALTRQHQAMFRLLRALDGDPAGLLDETTDF